MRRSEQLQQQAGQALSLLLLLLAACGQPATVATLSPPAATNPPPTSAPTRTPTLPAATATLVPLVTRTPLPTLTPVPTRVPAFASCVSYQPEGTEGPTWDIEVAPDGTVWVAAYRGVARLHPVRKEWIAVSVGEDEAGDQIRAISAGADGSVWLVTRLGEGVYRLEGDSWRHFTVESGLGSAWVNDVTQGPEGAYWFATDEGITRWDEDSGTWDRYTDEDWLYTNAVQRVLFTPDGRIWAAHREAMRWWVPPETDATLGSFGTYGLSLPLATGKAVVSADGRLWIGQAFYDPENQIWRDTVYRQIHLQAQAVDGDGGVWIARSDGAIYIPEPASSPPQDWLRLGKAEGLGGENVTVIALERDNAIWFGTHEGVTRCLLGGLRRTQ